MQEDVMDRARWSMLLVVVFAIVDRCHAADAVQSADVAALNDEFTEKTIVVFLNNQMRVPSVILERVSLRDLGGRQFLIGTGADTKREGDWWTGKAVRVAWSTVAGYIIFTKQQYEEFIKEDNDD
jgi:hypothetical protein